MSEEEISALILKLRRMGKTELEIEAIISHIEGDEDDQED